MEVLRAHQVEFVLALAALVLVQFAYIASMQRRMKRFSTSFRTLLSGPTGEDLESLITRAVAECKLATDRCSELQTQLDTMQGEMRDCFRHVGLVRYDAFHDVSGHQSFSLAMLDGNLNGAVITGLFGRQDSRCFGKAIIEGRNVQPLSDEEDKALVMAINGGLSAYFHNGKNGAHGRRRDKAGGLNG